MAKKETKFTDIPIVVCEKECHFNRVTNHELTIFSQKAEKEYDSMVKVWTAKADELTLKGEKLEKQISRKEKMMELIESQEDYDVKELIAINNELTELDKQLNDVTEKLLAHREKNPVREYSNVVDKTLADKVDLLLDNINAKQYLELATPKDVVIARNLEKYYQMAMMGERAKKIEVEIEEDMVRFLKEQEEIRNQQ